MQAIAGSSSTAPAAPDLAPFELARERVVGPRRRISDPDRVDVAVHQDLDRADADSADHAAQRSKKTSSKPSASS